MEEEVLQIIKKNNIGYKELLKKTNIDEKELDNLINKLINKRLIFLNDKEKYNLLTSEYVVARLKKCSKGFCYVMSNEEKIIIELDDLHTALNEDLVVVQRKLNNKGTIVGILERKNNKLVCEVKEFHNRLILVPFNGNKEITINADKNIFNDLIVGDRICIKLDNKADELNNININKFVKIGNSYDDMCDEISIAISKGFSINFSKEAEEEARKIPKVVNEKDKINRRDLTNEHIFTIDGVTTKDMDDAISIKKLNNGNYLLGVHIADVPYYISETNYLYNEVLERGTSVYIGPVVIPMLPSILSNGICSLNPNVPRLTKSVNIEYNPKKRKIVDYEIYNSVINSKKRMTYEDLNSYFKSGELDKEYLFLKDDIDLLREFSNVVTKNRKRHGALEFDSNDYKIKTDLYDEENIFGFEKRNIGEAEKIIENCMILANEAIATEFTYRDLPFIYRVHNSPDNLRLDSTIGVIEKLGYKLVRIQNAYGQKAIQNILDDYKGTPEYAIISNLILRSMSKAKYSTSNCGHYGLALDNYCHFTSPIRRLPDFIVHTLINVFLNNDYSKNNHVEYVINHLNEISEHASYKERQADDAEKDNLKLKMAKYMEKHMDEEFEGILLDVDKDNVYVKLNNNVKGVIDYTTDFARAFSVDSHNKVLYCNHSKHKINLGTKLLLKVSRVDVPQKEVYFDVKEIIKNQSINNVKKKELVKKEEN